MYQANTVCTACRRQSDVTYHGECLDCILPVSSDDFEWHVENEATSAKSGALDMLVMLYDLVAAKRIKEATRINDLLRKIYPNLEDPIRRTVASIAICIWEAAEDGRKLPRLQLPDLEGA